MIACLIHQRCPETTSCSHTLADMTIQTKSNMTTYNCDQCTQNRKLKQKSITFSLLHLCESMAASDSESSTDIVASCLSFKPKKFRKSELQPQTKQQPELHQETKDSDRCVVSAYDSDDSDIVAQSLSFKLPKKTRTTEVQPKPEFDPLEEFSGDALAERHFCRPDYASSFTWRPSQNGTNSASSAVAVDPAGGSVAAEPAGGTCVSAPEIPTARTNKDSEGLLELRPSAGVSYRLLSRVRYQTESRLLDACHDLVCRLLGNT